MDACLQNTTCIVCTLYVTSGCAVDDAGELSRDGRFLCCAEIVR